MSSDDIPDNAIPNAPIWHRPTPCPHPAPLKVTLSKVLLMPEFALMVKAELYKNSG